ncbi:hypothetical protein LOTGIDRAFT_168991 [Lottia gigantea]|uniref:Uncharacterized protein n=1 Tax=Lottia gigantea TaxID=225164 RepID=V3ZMS7_LOTGI|nr:hypothetical protein LOTGIDRAFT_168991 [Lottia gigantea]ESO83750.1 hypothetical protein LOTGIDRAFT_168991 [Lottia gigantea]
MNIAWVYGRCCFDYESVCKEESEKSKHDHENLMNVTIECDSKISGKDVPQQIITSCSLTNVSVKTVELCEEETRSSVVVTKVMSKRTKLHYKNRHCMLCNGEDEDDIVYWSTMIGTNNRRIRASSGNDILGLFRNPVIFIPPPNSREIICYPGMITSCIPSATHEEQSLCVENALSPIKYQKSMYKNTFCLQCNIVLEPTDGCFPANREDMFYGTFVQSFTLSILLNWKQNRESFVFLDSKMSLIQNLSCSFDDNDNVKECKVRKCVGSLPVVNNTCQIVPDLFGCIRYIFKINFTVPSESSREMALEVERISSKLVQTATTLERMHNVNKYYSQNVTLYNLTIVDDQLTGIIILNRMAYNLCNSQFSLLSYRRYYEYLDTNLAFNLTGSITTYRYSVRCYHWCRLNPTDVPIAATRLYQRFFTCNTEIDLDSTSSVTKLTPISVSSETKLTPISVYVVFLMVILVARLA